MRGELIDIYQALLAHLVGKGGGREKVVSR
jgi:hypothetical protein